MADIRPFCAIRYPVADQSTRVAPPYDILDQPEKTALLGRDRHNIVAIDLPHTPPKQAGPDHEYETAAATLNAWLADGTLRRDERPAIYVYHQHFRVDGRPYVRKMFFAALRLEEFGTGKVFPHEQTFGGPKEDRLKLMRTTRCNLSPIFGLYADPENAVTGALESAVSRKPDVTANADGVDNRLWCVTDSGTLQRVTSLLAPKPIFIADGHHRYGTALNYRNELVATRGALPADDPANFVLTVMVAMEDPGAIIQPTDRVLLDVPELFAKLPDALRERFEWTAVTDAPAALVAKLPTFGPQAIGVFDGPSGKAAIIRPKDADLLKAHEPNRAPAWRRLSYAILHRYVMDEVVVPKLIAGKAPTIHYIRKLEDTIAEGRQHRGVAFLMQPCTMTELRDVCSAGELMPQKTTYFYPKLATGLVIKPLY